MPRKRRERFSVRQEIRRPHAGLIYDDAPEPLRHGFLNLLQPLHFGALGSWQDVYVSFLNAIDKWEGPPQGTGETYYLQRVARLVTGCEWYHFYDLVEETVLLLRGDAEAQAEFVNRFNELVRRHYVGYEVRDGQLEWVGAREEEKSIAQARAILRDPELAGPDEQFQKAIGHFSRRPEPDLENCVKDAVGAVEGLARILLDDPSVLLSDAARELGKRKNVHPTLQKLMQNLYAYRGDVEGVAHGKTGKKAAATREDAEFVLSTSAACIVYLARLYGRGVE